MIRVIKGGVTAPKGFLASGVTAGIKKSKKKDLALLYSEVPAVAAGAFTTNRFKASPVKVSKLHLAHKSHQAVIVNSGNANCINGTIGDRDAMAMASFIAQTLMLDKKEVLVASTGIIGRYLPVEKIRCAIPGLIGELSEKNGSDFAEAILTTDTVKKEIALRLKIGSSVVTIGGACKGVGMIYPDMATERHATILCFITTDVLITKKMLESSLDEAIGESFNMISVDGDMSTNDSCFVLANGLAANKKIMLQDAHYADFVAGLKLVTQELAKKMVQDGEGATKFVEITVSGARTDNDARIIARKISTSMLLKCCINGEDPNWGRVIAAAGASGVDFNPDKVDVYLGDVKVMSNGGRIKDYDKDKAKKLFQKNTISLTVDVKSGKGKAVAWTCDLSKQYVDINAEYST